MDPGSSPGVTREAPVRTLDPGSSPGMTKTDGFARRDKFCLSTRSHFLSVTAVVLLICRPGLDPGSIARRWRLQRAALKNGPLFFATVDRKGAELPLLHHGGWFYGGGLNERLGRR